MSGLYQKALAIIQREQPLQAFSLDDLEDGEEQSISPEEREKVLAQINAIVAKSRIQITADTFEFTPKLRGSVLPIIINVAAAVILVAGILLAAFLFKRSEETIITRPQTVETAEGKLLEALKEESEQALGRKDQEIAAIQKKLANMNSERANLKMESEAELRRRADELTEAMNRELEAERLKLQASGVSEESIAQALRELEEEKNLEYSRQLETIQQQAQADLTRKEEAVNRLIGDYELALQEATTTRNQLQDELTERQQELETQFLKREAALSGDRARALQQLDQFQQQQEQEQLVLDQFLSFYKQVNTNLEGSKYEAALSDLDNFRGYLNQEIVVGLPAISRRRPVELFLIRSLEELIGAELTQSKQDSRSLLDAANAIASLSAAVDRGEGFFQDGKYENARKLYLSALAEIPAVDLGYTKLKQIEELFLQRDQDRIAALIAAGNTDYLSGDYQRAVEQYGEALVQIQGEADSGQQLVQRIMQSGYELKAVDVLARLRVSETTAAERAALLEELDAVHQRYLQLTDNGPVTEAGGNSRETLMAMLGTRLLVQKIIVSEPIRSQYPELNEKLDQYLRALVEENRKATQIETLQDTNMVLDSLIGRKGLEELPQVLERYADSTQQELLIGFIERIRILLR